MKDLEKELKKITGHSLKTCEVTIVFVEAHEMKKLNKNFRSKNKVTDILSFSDQGELIWTDSKRSGKSSTNSSYRGFLGELVLCGEVICSQAQDHQLGVQEELGYLLIHGLLHLLGYEHEKGGKKAKIMFELQDRLFEALRKG